MKRYISYEIGYACCWSLLTLFFTFPHYFHTSKKCLFYAFSLSRALMHIALRARTLLVFFPAQKCIKHSPDPLPLRSLPLILFSAALTILFSQTVKKKKEMVYVNFLGNLISQKWTKEDSGWKTNRGMLNINVWHTLCFFFFGRFPNLFQSCKKEDNALSFLPVRHLMDEKSYHFFFL